VSILDNLDRTVQHLGEINGALAIQKRVLEWAVEHKSFLNMTPGLIESLVTVLDTKVAIIRRAGAA